MERRSACIGHDPLHSAVAVRISPLVRRPASAPPLLSQPILWSAFAISISLSPRVAPLPRLPRPENVYSCAYSRCKVRVTETLAGEIERGKRRPRFLSLFLVNLRNNTVHPPSDFATFLPVAWKTKGAGRKPREREREGEGERGWNFVFEITEITFLRRG